jgi:hypothetical protein
VEALTGTGFQNILAFLGDNSANWLNDTLADAHTTTKVPTSLLINKHMLMQK